MGNAMDTTTNNLNNNSMNLVDDGGSFFDIDIDDMSEEAEPQNNTKNNKSFKRKRRNHNNSNCSTPFIQNTLSNDTMYDGVVGHLIQMGFEYDKVTSALSPYYRTKTPTKIVLKEAIDSLTGVIANQRKH